MTAVVEGELARGQMIILRTKTMADAQQDYDWRRDAELAAFDAARPYNGSMREYLSIFGDELSYPSPYRRTLGVADFDGTHIGNVMFYNMDYNRREAEIGITIGLREYWSRGYGTDLLRTFAAYLFETLPINRIYLKTLDWNFRAQRCFEKAGFKRYGASRRGEYNFILMEIFKRDFLSGREDESDEDS
ncbi:MAG TPA: GNAT family N-acetyltransferase [Dehalococcoidia bacterium]|nr:GNAT family N-acetyltransferase [Dehalococcoidia bacterium]